MRQVKIDRSGTRNAIRDVATDSVLWCWRHGYGCSPDCVAAAVFPITRLEEDGTVTPGVLFQCTADPAGRMKFEVVE